MNFAIQPMEGGDLDAVLSVAAGAPEAPQWPRACWAPYFSPDPGNPTLLRTAIIAVTGGAHVPRSVLGFGCATLLRFPDAADQNRCELDSIAVCAEARRQGVGGALLRELLSWATRNGAREFSLEVRASNAAAIALYQSFGLQLEGRRAGYYTQPEEDALLLGMQVTAGTP